MSFARQLAEMYAVMEEHYSSSSSAHSAHHPDYVSSHLDLGEDEGGSALLDNSAAKHKMAVRPQRKRRSESRNRSPSRKEDAGESSSDVESSKKIKSSSQQQEEKRTAGTYRRTRSGGRQHTSDPKAKREAVIRELVETEEEFVTDMEHVVAVYYRQMDLPTTPRMVSDQRDSIFGPFKQIQEFHKSVLLEGLKYYATNEPHRLGRTFLRLERDFDKHAQYYETEPKAQDLLREDNHVKEFFEDYSHRIGDNKRLSEYLKLPIQRINDFQILLQDLITHSIELKEDVKDLQKAHEFMLALPHRLSDAQFISNVSGYRGNIHKLGRLLRHDWWTVTDSRGRARERYLFLFKARILVTKVRRVTDDRNVFLLKDIIKLPDVEVKAREDEDPVSFDLIHSDPRFVRYPLNLRCSSGRTVHDDWLTEIRKYAADAVALQEHAEDDLQVDGPGETDTDFEEASETAAATIPGPQKREQQEPDSAQLAKKIKGLIASKGEVTKRLTTELEPLDRSESNESIKKSASSASSPSDYQTLASHRDSDASNATLYASMADHSSIAGQEDAEGTGNRPRFIRTIRGAFCEPGEKATFDCSIESVPECNVTWLRNNRPLDDRFADRIQIVAQGKTHKLVMMNCRSEDSGLYSALAVNPDGSTACSASLVVQQLTPEEREKMAKDKSPIFIVQLHDTELIVGSSVRFMIKVKGDPIPGVDFRKDGKKIVQSDRIKVVDDQAATGFYELVIKDVAESDAGEYSCNALNRFGESKSTAKITVTTENEVFQMLADQTATAPGEKPQFSWYRDGAPFDPEERFKVDFKDEEDTLSLVFQHVKPEDAGLYTCVAATSAGKISCSAELTVQGAVHHLLREPEPPSFTMDLTDTEVSCGGSAMMELKFKGFPKPKMTWTKGTEEVVAGGRYRFLFEDDETIALIIKNVNMDDAGLYTVTATNDLGQVTTEGRLYVKAPPKFKKKTQDTACMTEAPLKMLVEVEGSPAPELKWYKDGQVIIESERIKIVKESDDTYALVIEKVKIEDSGSYSVVASNSMGQMSDFWQMVANAPPSFLKELLKNREAEEGEAITFQVQVEGHPMPTVKWVKDGKELVHDGKTIQIKQDGGMHSLTVNGVKRSDTGKYSCVIANPYGTKEDSSNLKVRCKPEIKQSLKDVEAKEGDKDVGFTVKVDGHPEPKVKWFIDEIEITEERKEFKRTSDPATGTYSLIMKEVRSELSGKYTVQVTNDLGSVKSSAVLSVQYAPKIEQQLKDVTIEEGKSASLTLKASGLPEPTVKWFKDGNEVSADARIKIKKEAGSYSMSVDKCTAKDQGTYEAKILNSLGEASAKCTVTVDSKPKIISDNMVVKEIYEEEEIYYEVRASGQPKPAAQWTKNDETVVKSERIEIIETEEVYSLKIKKAEMTDAGNYTLKLSNRLGSESKSASLTVKSLAELRVPKILQGLNDTTISKGQTLEMKVRIRGQPTPDVEWFKDGKTLKGNKDYTMTKDEVENSYTLVLPNANETHAGKYSVKASNPHGFDESSASLTIVMKPELSHPGEVTVEYYEETNIEVKVTAHPKAKVKWLKEGIQIKSSERITITSSEESIYKLNIKETQMEDQGLYSFVATNKEGETKGDIKLNVHSEPPTFSKKPKTACVKPGGSAKFEGSVKGIPAPKIIWMKKDEEIVESECIKMETQKDGQFTLTITDVKESDYAEYTVKAVSAAGEASAQAELMLTSEPPTLGEKLPSTTKVAEGEPLKLSVKVDGSPQPDVKWYKDGQEIVPDEHVHVSLLPDGTAQLEIASALPEDSGAYKLVAINPSGQVSTQTAADVKKKPKKGTVDQPLPASVMVVQGQPLKLTAKISGHPKPDVKWMKDGKPVRPGGRVILTSMPDGSVALEIESAKPEDAGKYSLVVSNDLGESSSDSAVEIEPPPSKPVFIAPLLPVKGTEGFPVRLEAKVQGYPTPDIVWMKDGKKLKGVEASKKPEADGSVRLSIPSASPSDAGEYTAIAKNGEGEAKTSAKVDVRPKKSDGPETAPVILTPPVDVSVDEGGPVRLAATISGNPIPEVEWSKDGEPLPADRAVVTFDGDKVALEMDKVRKVDDGEYQLTVTNPLGSSSAKAKVSVRKIYSPPVFTQKFSDLQQLPGYDAKFMAKVTGLPKPSIGWTFNGKPISESDKYKLKYDGDICVLFIRDCSPGRVGRYACVATNSEGEDRCEADFEVVDKIEKKEKEERPYFLKRIGDCEVYEGMTAKFTACASGYPEPDYEWFRNGKKIEPGASPRIKMEREGSGLLRLTIKHVDEADVGQYSLRIFNPSGEATCSAELSYDTLDTRPKRPVGDQYADFDKFRQRGAPVPLADRPIINLITDRYLTLSWKPSIPIGPRIPVTYHVEMCELPDGDWQKVRSGIRGCCCDIRNLDPYRDYRFRIRVENQFGVSDPSPYNSTSRDRLNLEPIRPRRFLEPGAPFDPNTSNYFPKDYDLDRPPHEGYTHAPRFLRQETDVQYGVKNQGASLYWYVYGYPKPTVKFYFNDELIETGGGRFDYSYLRNGQLTLFVNRMLDRDAGVYEAVATNPHGEARQRIKLEIAEHPRFIERPVESVFVTRKPGRLQCRITGYPECEIKWFKDWQPLAPSSRIKMQQILPDTYFIVINDVITKDEGLYSVVARNPAGAASASAMVHVEESEDEFAYRNYQRGRNVKPKSSEVDRIFGDHYDLGDELGRGTQGITYHAVERSSGRSYAAKLMTGTGDLKQKMLAELDVMNQLNHPRLIRLHDAYETKDTMHLVTELAGGGDLVDSFIRRPYLTEPDIAHYTRQLLEGLKYMHDHGYAHLGLTPGDLLLARPDGDDLKIGDFGLARRIYNNKLAPLEFGMPEFVAPETANGQGVGLPADMWSVGVITYLFLSGISPFRGETDRDTLRRVQAGQINFDPEAFSNISNEAKDFVAKLLVFKSEGRLTVDEALRHPWLLAADRYHRDDPSAFQIPTERLKTYYGRYYRDWYSNASCRRWYRRRPLSGAFTHPSCMVYPPGEIYTPRPSMDREPSSFNYKSDRKGFEHPGMEGGVVSSESHYQYGPDTYLLQLRDVDFPARLRRYMKVASERSPLFSLRHSESNFDREIPIIHERRRFTDIMDEEIDDESRRARKQFVAHPINASSGDTGPLQYFRPATNRRIKHELGLRDEAHAEADAILEAKRHGLAPFLREKPQTVAMVDQQPVQLSCLAVGEPQPGSVQWYKNDVIIIPDKRISVKHDPETGVSVLKFNPALVFDCGVYKAVARNKVGQTSAKARLVMGDIPSIPDSPECTDSSDKEILLRWKVPRHDGNSPVLCYSLQMKLAADPPESWTELAANIDHEFFLIRDLQPETEYQFRLAARNRFGWSDRSIPTEPIKTKQTGSPRVAVTRAMKYLQQLTESGQQIEISPDVQPRVINYAEVESNPKPVKEGIAPTEDYTFIAEVSRGRFSLVAKCADKNDSNNKMYAAKIVQKDEASQEELKIHQILCHERIVAFHQAYESGGLLVTIMEKLQGVDVITCLSQRHEYTENMVATIISQVLDGLQYLHWRGIGHFDLQPDNVLLTSARSMDVKLCDFGCARKVSKLGTYLDDVKERSYLPYTAPEILNDELAFPQSDVWSLGVLTYVLLSGVSPFTGENDDETRQNISFVRFRFEHLYKEISMEATRFIMLVFKRAPNKRPSTEECLEHRWFQPSEHMLKKRERASFLGNRLKAYSEEYHQSRMQQSTKNDQLLSSFGLGLSRSISNQTDIFTTF